MLHTNPKRSALYVLSGLIVLVLQLGLTGSALTAPTPKGSSPGPVSQTNSNASRTQHIQPVPDGLSADDWASIQSQIAAEPYRTDAAAVDPLVQQAYLKASNTGVKDYFGYAVAVSGDTVVVGAPYEDSQATGVNGDQSDNAASDSGAAYVFVRSGTTWSQQAYLKASNTETDDNFGYAAAIDGDTLVVGAVGESSKATGVNGDQSDDAAGGAGAAYVFIRSGTTWSQQAYLKASNTGAGDEFGWSVAISGDMVVVGAFAEDSNATGVNGDQGDNSAKTAGAAYVFVRNDGVWSQQAYLKASNTEAFDYFGESVSISGDTVVVGADGEDSRATRVNGDQSDNTANGAGAAYVFVRSGVTWSQDAYLKASNTGEDDYFGYTVAIGGDTIIVGAPLEGSQDSGAAYVFVRNGPVLSQQEFLRWSQQAYLRASNIEAGDNFGYAVAIDGDTVVVGALYEDSQATGVNGDQNDNSADSAGAAYVFKHSGATWSQQAYLKASNTGAGDLFGYAVAIAGKTVVAGAYGEASRAMGVNGKQNDNTADISGAAYTFDGEHLLEFRYLYLPVVSK